MLFRSASENGGERVFPWRKQLSPMGHGPRQWPTSQVRNGPKAIGPTAGGSRRAEGRWTHRRWCAKSQDVHTPRVIASEFLSKTLCGCSLSSSAERRPETLQVQTFMDKVDGRPGAVAPQFGHVDATTGVPMLSLSLTIPPFSRNPKTHLPEDWPHRRWRRNHRRRP